MDFGITYLRLNTDTQQHFYVLKPGETEVPSYLVDAFDRGNRLQDIFTNNFEEGRTGNEVLAMSRAQAIEEGIKPSIYTHPIGYHGHAAGTTLGMWDSQGGVPGTGDYPLHLNTAYSIELNAASYIEEVGQRNSDYVRGRCLFRRAWGMVFGWPAEIYFDHSEGSGDAVGLGVLDHNHQSKSKPNPPESNG